MAAHRRHVNETLGSPRGIIIIDPTSFPKRGEKSVGVARQWCGQLGKEENCVVGVNLAYASEKGHSFLDRRLYLPKCWAEDPLRRREAGVPDDVLFRTSWELAYEMICQVRREGIPHGWIIGDEEFGKVPCLQDWLREDGERYVLEVPCTTRVGVALPKKRISGPRGLLERLRIRGPGRPRWIRVDQLAKRLSPKAWTTHEVRDASKGPIRVRAALLRVLHTASASLAHHWLVSERNRLGGEISRDDGRRDAPCVLLRATDCPQRHPLFCPEDETSTVSQPERAFVALEAKPWSARHARATQAGFGRSGAFSHCLNCH